MPSGPHTRSSRIAITGCGWVCPYAAGGLNDVLARLAEAAQSAPPAQSGAFMRVPDEFLRDVPLAEECVRDRLTWLAAVAFAQARRTAGFGPDNAGVPQAPRPERVGLCIGCALAGQLGMIDFAEDVRAQSARFVSPIRFPQTVGNYTSGALARAFDVRGPVSTLACGLQAVLEAARWLAANRADVAIAGGCETFAERIAKELAGDLPLSEGACLFVLEREADAGARGAQPLAIIDIELSTAVESSTARSEVTSCAGAPLDGSVYMEAWTGCSFAASGAAAIAAAIAALQGASVPVHGRSQVVRCTPMGWHGQAQLARDPSPGQHGQTSFAHGTRGAPPSRSNGGTDRDAESAQVVIAERTSTGTSSPTSVTCSLTLMRV